ncbi:flagellin [Methanocaldococcus infernus ME]|uniref:Flagellin n=1 Tax=Methanocaldococcus infernus (strain DSM 11812 / JCM 15783 / ME) TaxID=573063 RepID=D5VT57_METIM|nr:flagellar protein F [Methanocaldococcus infernus]ADG13760.1 flagellin [Methanocaldococcus infernus ME]
MGFSSVAGTVIMVISLLIVGAYLYTTIDSSYSILYKNYEAYQKHLENKINEKLVITKVSSSATQTNITIYNNGSVVVEPHKFTVLFDGTIVPPQNISYSPDVPYLLPLESITLIVNWTQPTRICIVSNYGNKYFATT